MSKEKPRSRRGTNRSPKAKSERARRESGQPGGGQGRRDQVGGSGVYPMSGPHPAGPAELRTPAAWGQGERGAAGYEDSGRSELSFRPGSGGEGGEVLGGLDSGAPGSPPAPGIEIPPAAWKQSLDDFSDLHRDCQVRVEQILGTDHKVQVDKAPLNGVSSDRPGARNRIYVSVGEKPGREITHEIFSPRRVSIDASGAGGIEIEADDGARTVIRCLEHRRSAA